MQVSPFFHLPAFTLLTSLYQWLTRATGVFLHQAWLDIYQLIPPRKDGQAISLLAFAYRLALGTPLCTVAIARLRRQRSR